VLVFATLETVLQLADAGVKAIVFNGKQVEYGLKAMSFAWVTVANVHLKEILRRSRQSIDIWIVLPGRENRNCLRQG
jgi:hypothetical protein